MWMKRVFVTHILAVAYHKTCCKWDFEKQGDKLGMHLLLCIYTRNAPAVFLINPRSITSHCSTALALAGPISHRVAQHSTQTTAHSNTQHALQAKTRVLFLGCTQVLVSYFFVSYFKELWV
jgi:hypothetical protein